MTTIVCKVTKDLVENGVIASDIIKAICSKGGGSKSFAQGKSDEDPQIVLQSAEDYLQEFKK